MNSSLLYILMLGVGLIMAVLPFAVFMGLASVLGIPESDSRMLVTYMALALGLSYALSVGAFSIIQKSNCGEINNFKQIATSAFYTLGFNVLLLGLAIGFPWVAGIVGNLLPPDVGADTRQSVVFAYYSLWATVFGIALGGATSGSCGSQSAD